MDYDDREDQEDAVLDKLGRRLGTDRHGYSERSAGFALEDAGGNVKAAVDLLINDYLQDVPVELMERLGRRTVLAAVREAGGDLEAAVVQLVDMPADAGAAAAPRKTPPMKLQFVSESDTHPGAAKSRTVRLICPALAEGVTVVLLIKLTATCTYKRWTVAPAEGRGSGTELPLSLAEDRQLCGRLPLAADNVEAAVDGTPCARFVVACDTAAKGTFDMFVRLEDKLGPLGSGKSPRLPFKKSISRTVHAGPSSSRASTGPASPSRGRAAAGGGGKEEEAAGVEKAPALARADSAGKREPPKLSASARSAMQAAREEALQQVLVESAAGSIKEPLSMVVVGHVDAGKSTLMGHLLMKVGVVASRTVAKYESESRSIGKSSFHFAWVMDEHAEERERGVTMDCGMNYFETEERAVTLLDAPGHRDFIPSMISGAAQADVAILVVPACVGEFEGGFEAGGQTKEHSTLVRSLGVRQLIVAVNKMDAVEWSQPRFNAICAALKPFLASVGFRPAAVRYIPVSGMTGGNLVDSLADEPAAAWYSGDTLVGAINSFDAPARPVRRPSRLAVSDVYRTRSLGLTIGGKLDAGVIVRGEQLLVMPGYNVATVRGIERRGTAVQHALAGENVDIGLTGIDDAAITVGSVLCAWDEPVPLMPRFKAQVMILPTRRLPIVKGARLTLHMQSVEEPVVVTKLISLLTRDGKLLKRRPRHLTAGQTAHVNITPARSLCVELYSSCRSLGRFTLRDEGKTVAVGIITKLKAARRSREQRIADARAAAASAAASTSGSAAADLPTSPRARGD
eukprot:PLAT3518.1.p1 GENE.PLAT3518.1~~PLAT3518.1.p1  ORF type:complete len:812 (-),score=367.56 PLAT3518.1:191-2584(-)